MDLGDKVHGPARIRSWVARVVEASRRSSDVKRLKPINANAFDALWANAVLVATPVAEVALV